MIKMGNETLTISCHGYDWSGEPVEAAKGAFITAAKNEAPDIARYALLLEKALELASRKFVWGKQGCPYPACEKDDDSSCVGCIRDYFLNKAKEGVEQDG